MSQWNHTPEQARSRRLGQMRRPGGFKFRPELGALEDRTMLSLLATSTAVLASTPAAVYGQVVTVTATVLADPPASGIPTGTVTFYDGSLTLGTATLVHGTAALRAPLTAVGQQWITASYSGDVIFAGSASGTETIVAGTGTAGYSGDGGPATSAELNEPLGVAVDSAGNLYFADSANNCIREVLNSTGQIFTVAGTGTAGYSGDGGPATRRAQLPDRRGTGSFWQHLHRRCGQPTTPRGPQGDWTDNNPRRQPHGEWQRCKRASHPPLALFPDSRRRRRGRACLRVRCTPQPDFAVHWASDRPGRSRRHHDVFHLPGRPQPPWQAGRAASDRTYRDGRTGQWGSDRHGHLLRQPPRADQGGAQWRHGDCDGQAGASAEEYCQDQLQRRRQLQVERVGESPYYPEIFAVDGPAAEGLRGPGSISPSSWPNAR